MGVYGRKRFVKVMKKKIQTAVDMVLMFLSSIGTITTASLFGIVVWMRVSRTQRIVGSKILTECGRNHDWQDLYPYTLGEEKDWLYTGKVTPESFEYDWANELISKVFHTTKLLED